MLCQTQFFLNLVHPVLFSGVVGWNHCFRQIHVDNFCFCSAFFEEDTIGAASGSIEHKSICSVELLANEDVMIGSLDLQTHLLPFLDLSRLVNAIVIPEYSQGCSYDLILLWLEQELAYVL